MFGTIYLLFKIIIIFAQNLNGENGIINKYSNNVQINFNQYLINPFFLENIEF